jgi:hypothetical protein
MKVIFELDWDERMPPAHRSAVLRESWRERVGDAYTSEVREHKFPWLALAAVVSALVQAWEGDDDE